MSGSPQSTNPVRKRNRPSSDEEHPLRAFVSTKPSYLKAPHSPKRRRNNQDRRYGGAQRSENPAEDVVVLTVSPVELTFDTARRRLRALALAPRML